jgi:hypothetical protein
VPLVYPPLVEKSRPPNRFILLIAANAVILLAASGLLLVREAVHGNSGSAAPAASFVPAKVTAEVSLGPGNIVTESEHIDFEQAVSTLRLAVPLPPALADGAGKATPRISNLLILDGSGNPVKAPDTVDSGTTLTVSPAAPTDHFDVIFIESGGVMPNPLLDSGERDVVLSPLRIDPPSSADTTLLIRGSTIDAINCLAPGQSQPIACGSSSADVWNVQPDAGATVIAVVRSP